MDPHRTNEALGMLAVGLGMHSAPPDEETPPPGARTAIEVESPHGRWLRFSIEQIVTIGTAILTAGAMIIAMAFSYATLSQRVVAVETANTEQQRLIEGVRADLHTHELLPSHVGAAGALQSMNARIDRVESDLRDLRAQHLLWQEKRP